jgi:hypothetical protein
MSEEQLQHFKQYLDEKVLTGGLIAAGLCIVGSTLIYYLLYRYQLEHLIPVLVKSFLTVLIEAVASLAVLTLTTSLTRQSWLMPVGLILWLLCWLLWLVYLFKYKILPEIQPQPKLFAIRKWENGDSVMLAVTAGLLIIALVFNFKFLLLFSIYGLFVQASDLAQSRFLRNFCKVLYILFFWWAVLSLVGWL